VFKADIGITFATLAAVYAVDDAYRGGNAYGVDTDALKDLLRSWAFGASISLVRVYLLHLVRYNTINDPDCELPSTPSQSFRSLPEPYIQKSRPSPVNHRLVARGGSLTD
jgi:hypothetical protein